VSAPREQRHRARFDCFRHHGTGAVRTPSVRDSRCAIRRALLLDPLGAVRPLDRMIRHDQAICIEGRVGTQGGTAGELGGSLLNARPRTCEPADSFLRRVAAGLA
jgi:hypothetical protein